MYIYKKVCIRSFIVYILLFLVIYVNNICKFSNNLSDLIKKWVKDLKIYE